MSRALAICRTEWPSAASLVDLGDDRGVELLLGHLQERSPR
jgi:hypothetical protein